MSWVRLDDGFADHPKVVSIGKTALAVHLWAMCYSARQLTDGFIPLGVLSGCPWVSKRSALLTALGRLEGVGLWKRQDGGFQINDFLEFNPSRAQIHEKRRQTADRVAKWRGRQQKRSNAPGNAVTGKSSNAAPLPAPKAGENGAAPLGAHRLLDNCVGCGEHRPIDPHELLCDDCRERTA